MRKIISLITILILLTGCNTKELLNTPTKKVEMFFSRYQSLDDKVMNQLNDIVNDEISFTDKQREEYIEIMKKHYQALKYEIKDEVVDANSATVTAEIEVIDYAKILEDADTYLDEHPEEFNNENGEYNETLYNDYRLEKLKKAEDKVKYTIDINLTKIDEEWIIDDLDSDTEDKIQGVYRY